MKIWQWGALIVGAIVLTRPAASGAGGFPAFFGGGAGGGLGSGSSGLSVLTADEDVGTFPDAGLFPSPDYQEQEVSTAPGNVPVASSQPVRYNVDLIGNPSAGFNLVGIDSQFLQGDSPINVKADPVKNPYVFSEFATTPDVLARYLSDPTGPVYATPGTNVGNTFDPVAADIAAQIHAGTSPNADFYNGEG